MNWDRLRSYVQWDFKMEQLPPDKNGNIETVVRFIPKCVDPYNEPYDPGCDPEEMKPFYLTYTKFHKGSCRWRKHYAEDKTETLRIRRLELLDRRRCKRNGGDGNYLIGYFVKDDGSTFMWDGQRYLSEPDLAEPDSTESDFELSSD